MTPISKEVVFRFEIRVFQRHSNLMKVVAVLDFNEDSDVALDSAIDILHNLDRESGEDRFFGQVVEVFPGENLIHYEINA